MKYIICLAVFIFLHQMNIFTQWQHATGLYGGDVLDVKADINNNFYASCGGNEIYVSTNNGISWIPSYNGLPLYKSISHIAVNNNSVFAGGIGINISTNHGQSWMPINSGLPQDPDILSIFADNNWIFIRMQNPDLIYKSSNSGTNWILSNTPLDTNTNLLGIINGIVYAATYSSVLYKSTNYGINWIQANNGLPSDGYYSLAQGNNKIFLSTQSALYASTNNGSSWLSTSLNIYCYALTAFGNNIYASGAPDINRVFYSSDNGINWSNGSPGLHEGADVSSLARNSTTLAAGSRTDGIYKSTDNGMDWIYSSTGITGTYCHKICINNTNIFALNYERGINLSNDNGTTWNTINSNLPSQFQPQTIAARDNYLITASPNFGVYISTNFGSSWSYSYTPNSKDNIRDFIIYGDTVIAGGFGDVIYSSNSGTNWVSINNGLPNNPFVFSLAKISNTIFASVNYHGVYASTNSGVNWNTVNNGLPGSNFTVQQLKTDGVNITAPSRQGLFLSTNNGVSWQDITHNLQSEFLYSIEIKGNNIFAASGYGFYVSNDLSANWRLENSGLRNLNLVSLAVSNNFVYSGVLFQSVWKRPLSEIIGIKPVSNSVPMNYRLGQNYPNPFNPATKIKFDIPASNLSFGEGLAAVLTVYNILGKEITTLVNESLKPGSYEVEWNASNYPSGIYFYRLAVNPSDRSKPSKGYIATKKMILVK